jgi:hypothetical protein
VWREEIDNFAFSFVAPLRAEHGQVHIGLRFYLQMIFSSGRDRGCRASQEKNN